MVLLGTAVIPQLFIQTNTHNLSGTVNSFVEEDSLEVSDSSLPNTHATSPRNVKTVQDDDWKNKIVQALRSLSAFHGPEKSGSASGPLPWFEGRGRDAVEVSQALEAFVSTIKLTPVAAQSCREVGVGVVFGEFDVVKVEYGCMIA